MPFISKYPEKKRLRRGKCYEFALINDVEEQDNAAAQHANCSGAGCGQDYSEAEMETLKHDRNPTGSKRKLPNHSPTARA